MRTKPTFISTLDNNAPAGEGALSLASIPAVYIGTKPNLAVNPVKIKMKASRSQKIFNACPLLIRCLKERSSVPAWGKEKLRNNMPINTKVMLMAQTKTYFHVPSSDRL